jgi:hypothetical protein
MRPEIELLTLKLADGARILRLSEPISGISLEKRLDAKTSIAQQAEHWKSAFFSLLERESGAR